MEREKAHTRKEIIPVSHLRHTSDKTCNVKVSPNTKFGMSLCKGGTTSWSAPRSDQQRFSSLRRRG
jgi:hypothetical protein